MKRSAWRYLWAAKDIRRKLLITLLILAIYRLAAHVPVPGANLEVIAQLTQAGGAGQTLVGLLDLLSGGTVSNFSVMAMGVYPYITSQIILQLLVPIIPSWQRRMEEDPREGRKWMEKWTLMMAVPMAALQAFGQINIFSSLAGGMPVVDNFGFSGSNLLPSLTVVLSMTAGTMFAIWLGELISEFGIRNQGLSLIIFAGIVSRVPVNIMGILSDEQTRIIGLIMMLVITILTIFAVVFVQQGRRNIPVMYPGRRMGKRMSMPVKGTLPLMINMAGMIPLIFAQSLLTFPAILASFFVRSETEWLSNLALSVQNIFGGQSDVYWLLYFLGVVGFTFFYTNVLFAQQNYGENLKKVGARIPGVSPGVPTQRYLNRVLSRITLPGALFLGLVAILPWLLTKIFPIPSAANLLLVSSAGLLIVVGVVRDTFFNIEAELKLHGYDDAALIR
ncbi:MAG: preprotein translocase subunit SecY [Chloroflexota bacterium]|nr:preprotein translocase subunit SecY [Chloroflexota bacterium]